MTTERWPSGSLGPRHVALPEDGTARFDRSAFSPGIDFISAIHLGSKHPSPWSPAVVKLSPSPPVLTPVSDT